MKNVKKLISSVMAMVCTVSCAVPIGAFAESTFPEERVIFPSYNTADLNSEAAYN